MPVYSDNPASQWCRENIYANRDRINIFLSNKKYFGFILGLWFIRTLVLSIRLMFSRDIIFLSTFYYIPFFKRSSLKTITVIHDLVFFDKKERFKKNLLYYDDVASVKHTIKKSDKIIAVSHFTKQAIQKKFPGYAHKVEVVYHGLDREFLSLPIERHKEKFFLYVGGRNIYKNFDFLLRVFAKFISKYSEWKLCLVGPNDHSVQDEMRRYKELGIDKNIIDYGLVTKTYLCQLMQTSSAVVIPSLYEGFNFPLLEGLAAGTQVFSSNIDVSKEIGKTYAKYFDPMYEEELLELMIDLRNNAYDYPALVEAQKYARTYTWERSYEKFREVMNDV